MVGKLLAHKNYNKEAFMSFFKNLWRLKTYVSICSLCGDIFLFAFQFESDCSSVLNGGPWSFKQMLLVLAIVKECDVLDFWHTLNYMSAKMGKIIGQSLGSVLKVNQNRHGDCLGKFLHIKVDIDMF
ncbi:hypothetical protein DVH24_005693 [Malus domestica]|uniref:DUF4283 domain-containing protein n=1 Tax=Malus domestica TaxID=3750 RepID=A0A498IJV5_MALDO|nr:hypothetical protein DVH24_005693 [Malus domestica]